MHDLFESLENSRIPSCTKFHSSGSDMRPEKVQPNNTRTDVLLTLCYRDVVQQSHNQSHFFDADQRYCNDLDRWLQFPRKFNQHGDYDLLFTKM